CRNVVLGDHLLRRDLECNRAQVDLDDPVDDGDQEGDAGAFRVEEPSEPEDDAALVLTEDSDEEHGLSFQACVGVCETVSSSSRRASTWTCSPARSGAPSRVCARQSSPATKTRPPSRTSPLSPTSVSGPNTTGRRLAAIPLLVTKAQKAATTSPMPATRKVLTRYGAGALPKSSGRQIGR